MTVEALIIKATDAALTADNWQFILDVTDKISLAPEDDTKTALKVVATRLALNDANVMLRTLSLLVAMAENCGSRMKQEIATKLFLQDSLIKRLGNKKLHKTVKARIVQVIEQLYDTFKQDPSLKPMTDAYNQAMFEYSQYSSKKHRVHSAPDKPSKQEISEADKKKEEDELQRILKVSLNEYEREQSIKNYMNVKPLPELKQEPAKLVPQKTAEQTIATVTKVRALYDLVSYEPEELSFRKGDVITVIESVYRDWWRGSLPGGIIGIFPLNYVTPIVSQTAAELAEEVTAEDKLIHSELRKVDKLLSLLSSGGADLNEDEVTQLYNEVVPLRTQLGKYIDKYSVRKEELIDLNNHFNIEVKEYDALLEKLILQRSQGRHQSQNGLPYPVHPGQQVPWQAQYTGQPQTQHHTGQSQLTGQSQHTGQSQLTGQLHHTGQLQHTGQQPHKQPRYTGQSSQPQFTGQSQPQFTGQSSQPQFSSQQPSQPHYGAPASHPQFSAQNTSQQFTDLNAASQPRYTTPAQQPKQNYANPQFSNTSPTSQYQQTSPNQHQQSSQYQQSSPSEYQRGFSANQPLELQPTSSGFGNAYSSDPYDGQSGQHAGQLVGQDPRFLNINNFPSLNS